MCNSLVEQCSSSRSCGTDVSIERTSNDRRTGFMVETSSVLGFSGVCHGRRTLLISQCVKAFLEICVSRTLSKIDILDSIALGEDGNEEK